MEVHDKVDVEKLGECIGGKGLKVKGLDGWRMPRVKIFDIVSDLKKEEIAKCVKKRNPELFVGMNETEAKEAFVPEFAMGRMREWCEWVVRVSTRMCKRMIMCERVFVRVEWWSSWVSGGVASAKNLVK